MICNYANQTCNRCLSIKNTKCNFLFPHKVILSMSFIYIMVMSCYLHILVKPVLILVICIFSWMLIISKYWYTKKRKNSCSLELLLNILVEPVLILVYLFFSWMLKIFKHWYTKKRKTVSAYIKTGQNLKQRCQAESSVFFSTYPIRSKSLLLAELLWFTFLWHTGRGLIMVKFTIVLL